MRYVFLCSGEIGFLQEFAKAKHMGNYHPALKQVYETPKSTNRKRQRGLKLGVGSFGGGVLKLSQKEAASAQGILGRSQGKRKR